jgi:hypothetical protein
MKKILFIFPLLIAGLLFNGCDKDEEETADAVTGCMEATACNYNPAATESDNSCTFADPGYDCDDNCLSKYMEGNMEYDLDGMAYFLDYGFYEDYYDYGYDENWNYDLYMMSDGFYWSDDYSALLGSGQYFYFELFFENGVEGTYSFSEEWGESETFTYNSWSAANIGADDYSDDGDYFTGGSLTITSVGGDNYEVSFDCTNANGEEVVGCFTGQIEYLEYQYARNLKTKNQKSVTEKKDRNR